MTVSTTELERLRRRLTPAVRPAIFAFTRIEANAFPSRKPRLVGGQPLPLAVGVSAPLAGLHARLFEEATGALAADLGDVAFEADPDGGLATAPVIPEGLPPGPFLLVLEGHDGEGHAAGCEVSLDLS